MGTNYKQLTLKDREILDLLLRKGKTQTFIAKQLGVHKSTISRELKRSKSFKNTYLASRADHGARYLKRVTNRHERLKNPLIENYVRNKLLQDWSPELIAGRIKLDLPGHSISHEAIYQYVYSLDFPNERRVFIGHLTRRHVARRHKYPGRRPRSSIIKNRISIEERPKSVESRKQPGHWEGDSLVSQRSRVTLNSLIERTTRLLLLTKIPRKGSKETTKAVIARLRDLPKNMRRTLTLDNGTEFARHEKITQSVGARCFFAHPFSPFERGSNEQINGLVRRYLPKSTDFANISVEQIRQIENRINQRPRKCLGFRKPLELASELGVALPV